MNAKITTVMLFAAMALIFGLSGIAQAYTFTKLDYPGASFTSAEDINDSGKVVGHYYNSPLVNNNHGYIYDGTTYTSLDFPGASRTHAFGINDSDIVAGRYNDGGTDHGFFYDGAYTSLDVPSSIGTAAWDINNSNDIVGYYVDDTEFKRHGFIYKDSTSTFTPLNFPGANETYAYGLNDSGVVVGTYVDSSFTPRGFVYNGSTYVAVNYPGALMSNADGINNSGIIVGRYKDSSNNWHGFIYDGSNYTALDVDLPGTTYTQAIDINNSGNIAGKYYDGSIYHGFIAQREVAPLTNANLHYAATNLEPINTFTGELFNDYPPDLNLGGPMPLYFQRYYASYLRRNYVLGDLGSNWRHNFDSHLNWSGTEITFTTYKGRVTEFRNNGSSWDQLTNNDTSYQLLVNGGEDVVLYDPDDDRIYTYDYTTGGLVTGKLVKVEDGKGNVHSLNYNTTNGQLVSVSDGLGRVLNFTYNSNSIPKIESVSDGARFVTFEYLDTIDTEYLTRVTDARGGTTTYTYEDTSTNADHALMRFTTRPRSNIPYTQTFFDTSSPASGRVSTQTDANGNAFGLYYSGLDTTLTDPLGNTRVHTHTATGEFSVRQDEAGESFSMGADADGRRNSITDRLGDTTSVDYDAASGNISAVTNADATTSTYSYTPRVVGGVTLHDLTGITHADGTSESFVYDAFGNLTSAVDQAGNVLNSTYNLHGQPLSVTNVAGGVTAHTYNADKTRATTQDPAGNTTSFSYDTFRRLNLIIHPDTNTQSFTYDAENRLLTSIDENNNTATLSYDANGNLETITDPLLNTTSYSYDGNDRLISTTDPLSNTSSLSFDELGRLKTTTDANGNVTILGYDVRGRRTSTTDPMGEVWETSYDAEAIIASAVDPLGNTTSFTSDSMGRVTQVTTPLGHSSGVSYDAMGRLANITDPLGNTNTYSYDPRGLLSSVSLADNIISASYTRDALGNITIITDPNGNDWQHSYDNQGRHTGSTDPLGNAQSIAFDNRNRPNIITYPGSLGTQSLDYDPVGNITGRNYSDGTTLSYSYDANGRIISADGITLSYDANGRITESNGIAITRDAGGRITDMTLASGRIISYSYDANDRVTQVTDWLGGITSFSYDVAGRLTTIARPNGVNTTNTYDDDSNLTGIAEGTISNISLTRDAKGQITAATRDVPQAASAKNLASIASSFDAAAQLSSASYDAMGRVTGDGTNSLTWDLASRITEFSDGGKTISATYDATGMRLSRTEAGETRNYTWNYALGFASISIEKQSGIDAKYYIHTPGGSLLYSIDAATNDRSFYHYDEMGNTLFISDDAGTVIGGYAYTPYGRLIAESGMLDNPFTWQGRFGVMTEGNDVYYLRARYYDAHTGRFISRDPVDSLNPKEINPYQYALGNPLMFVDVVGRESVSQRQINKAIAKANEVVARKRALEKAGVTRDHGGYYAHRDVLDADDAYNKAHKESIVASMQVAYEARYNQGFAVADVFIRLIFDQDINDIMNEIFDAILSKNGFPEKTSTKPSGTTCNAGDNKRDTYLLKIRDQLTKAREKLRKAQDALATGAGPEFDKNFESFRKARTELRTAMDAFDASGQVESIVPELAKIVVLC